MTFRIGDPCQTPDGPGTIVNREVLRGFSGYRFGVKHDTYPTERPKGLYKNDLLYYWPTEIKRIATTGKVVSHENSAAQY